MAPDQLSDLLGLPLNLQLSYDGGVLATPESDEGVLLPYLQAPPMPPAAPEAHLNQLKLQYLEPNLDLALGDVSQCGHILFPTPGAPAVLPECSAPTGVVEPCLPAGPDAAQGVSCGWRERHYSSSALEQLTAQGLYRRLVSRHATREEGWRGFAVSTPYLPGAGDAAFIPGMDTNKPEAVEAQTGLWLAQLESGRLPQVCAPGLQQGLFGAWQRSASEVEAEQVHLRQQVQQGGAGAWANTVQHSQGTHQGGSSGGAAPGAAGGLLLPVSFKVDQAAELKGVFDDVWMLGLDASMMDQEEESEEAEAEEEAAQQQAAAQGQEQGAAGASGMLQLPTLPDTLTEPDGTDGVDDILLAADQLVTQAHTRRQAGVDQRPVLGAASALGQGNTEWAVRGGVPDLDHAWTELKPRLAAQYPFELDVFQKEAIVHLERGESVFVAAHTSAGKTVVAEYAFALATQHCTRAIYTSPIKTISNQKYRDLSGKFDVGLLTGDVQLNPSGACLIMTTEILRSMLYRGADLIRDVEWVVFDEVHYVNDADRGVVWEEVIIMLPPHVGIVMLSATVPNLMDFADWVGRIKKKVIYVSGTLKRPVPLQHSLYYGGELYTVCTRETFVPEGIKQAQQANKSKNEVSAPRQAQGGGGRGGAGGGGQGFGQQAGRAGNQQQGGRGGGGGRAGGGGGAAKAQQTAASAMRAYSSSGPSANSAGGRAGERQQMFELVQLLKKKQMMPVAVFAFSKKRCDSAAHNLGTLDLTTGQEKHTIHVFLEKVLTRLKEADRQLPQILRLRELMRRGLAVHHAGLLPVMKEAVEMLFCQGYIKVLFCTETFAMGVNAPTRTVVFHSLRKHDGKEFRYLLPGEYTQMAGRAGRRGLDPMGNVLIACWDDIPDEGELRRLLTGRGVSLGSQFRLTYSMITNMMRVEDLKVEDMLRRSFAEWQAQRSAPKAAAALAAVQGALAKLRALPWPTDSIGCTREEVEEYYHLSCEINRLSDQVQEAMLATRQAQAALVPGRFLMWHNPITGLTEPAVYLGETPDNCRMTAKTQGSGSTSMARAGSLGLGGGLRGTGGSGPGSKRAALLVLHSPGQVDERHLAHLREQREAEQAAGKTQAAAQAAMQDMFAGMVMVGGKGRGGGGGGTGRGAGPGPLPRYGQAGALHFMLADAALTELVDIGKGKCKIDPAELLSGDWGPLDSPNPQLSSSVKSVLADTLRALSKEVAEGPNGSLPVLDVRSDLKLNDLEISQALDQRAALLAVRAGLRPAHSTELSEQFSLVRATEKLREQEEKLKHELSDASLQALPEFETRVRILQQLGYLDPDRSVTLKGRVLCEINSSQDELISSELVFSGVLDGLSPAEAVALVSALVFQEKSEVEPELPPALAEAKLQLEQLALTTAEVALSEGLQIEPQEVVANALHPGLMQVVYEWAKGTPFAEICTLTDVMEGSIVRAVVRLDQMCRELQDAARVMGNTNLFAQMQAASAAIKRDVVFAASLYIA